MPISFSRYVDINSVVIGANPLSVRQFGLNLFTVNSLLPPNSFITFNSAAEVGSYFGTSSEEYYRAQMYFGFVSKNGLQPVSIQYTRWAQSAVAGAVLGYGADVTLADWNAVTSGSLGLTIQVLSFVQTGIVTNTSVNITALQSTANMFVGMPISGSGIPALATIASIVSSTAITISAAATSTPTPPVSLTFGSTTGATQITGLNFSSATSLGASAFSLSATVTSSSANVTLASTTGIYDGMPITGAGIPANTTVVSFVANTSLVMSNPATSSESSLTFLPSVAAILQSAINSVTANGIDWINASVTYSGNNFQLIGGVVGNENIAVQAGGTGTDISGATANVGLGQLGWFNQATFVNGVFIPGAIWQQGSTAQTVTQALNACLAVTNNFGGVAFCYTGINSNLGLTLTQYEQVAAWNASLNPNVQFKVHVPVIAANASTWYAGLNGFAGVNMVLTDYSAPVSLLSQFPELLDAAIQASTDYTGTNSVQNYMFQLYSALRSLVTTDTQANIYDALNINYMGLTQNAGQTISFYQRGFLQGAVTAPLDSGIYANEQWLKAAIAVAIMNLLVGKSYVPADNQGISQISAILQSVITQALVNGTISVGKSLNAQQIADITAVTGNQLAWIQVQNIGYYLLVTITEIPSSSPIQYQANYLLVYSKNDVIRKVVGTDYLV
jgi:hypothetical protein